MQPTLMPIGVRPPLFRYLRDTWRFLPFSFRLALARIQAESARTKIGFAWVVVRPILNACIYGVIFGLIMGASRPDNYIAFLIVGVFFFEYFSLTFSGGSKSIAKNESIVRAVSFPRIALPISVMLEELVNLVIVLFVMAFILVVLGNFPMLSWLWLIPIATLFTVFNFGMALIAARIAVSFRDLIRFIPLITRLIMYGSGVLFALENLLKDFPTLLEILSWNPVYAFLSLARGAMLSEYQMLGIDWMVAGLWSIIVLVVGFIVFWAAEVRYGRDS